MSSFNPRPKWWQLYLTVLLLIALFILEHQLKTSTGGHEAVQIGSILLVYGLIYWWLKANSRALSRMDRQKYYGRVMVVQTSRFELSETKEQRSPILQIPKSEVKGVLSDTFEMDNTIDGKLLHIDNISEEMNKE